MNRLPLFLTVFPLLLGVARAAEPLLEATAFTPPGMVGSVVGISLDHKGRAYVTQTNRRTYGAVDIRKHMDWVIETLGSQSIEDKRKLVRERFKSGVVGDANLDGVVDWHDLTVPTELILMLEDTDGDGTADRKEVFADGFNTEITGLAGSVLVRGGDVYTTIIPSLWHLRDTDGDFKADEREEIVTGFGLHFGYGGHDMHGLTEGPDGRIYWSIGDKALSVTEKDGGHHHFPYHGAILRCDADGSNFEVFAKGLRNPQEMAFDEYGHLFVVDNDGDFGDGERFHYLLEGSDSGWRSFYQYRNNKQLGDVAGYNALLEENLSKPYFAGQSAAITPCIANFSEGPAGFTYNPGTALSEALEGHFFLTEFPGKRLQAFKAEPDGAGFRMTDPRVIFGGHMLVGINFGPDGALYAADWGDNEWVPHQKGRILRMDVPEADQHPLRAKTKEILRDGIWRLPEGQLLTLIGYPDQRVRLAAQAEIVRRGDFTILRQTAITDSRKIARIHGIWGCAQLVREREGESLQGLVVLLKHRDPEIRAQILKAFGETRSKFALELVKDSMFDSNPRVRLHAALALHHLAGPKDIKGITQYIAANGEEDVFRRHGGVRALTGAARGWPELLVDLQEHESYAVRLAAVVAHRRLHETAEETKTLEDPEEFAGIATFLADPEENVVVEAARAIHDVFQPSRKALLALAEMLNETKLKREPFVRRAINANRLLADAASAERLLAYAATAGISDAMVEEALKSATTWIRAVPIDRVQGFARVSPEGSREGMHQALQKHFGLLSKSGGPALVDLVEASGYQPGAPFLMRIAKAESTPSKTRVRAMEALVTLGVTDAGQLMKDAASSEESAMRQVAHRYLAQRLGQDQETVVLLTEALSRKDLKERQQAYRLLGESKAVTVLRAEAVQLGAGKRAPEIQLDLMEAVRASTDEEALKSLAAYEASKATEDPLAKYGETLKGGDRSLGKGIFQTNVIAQCIRCHQYKGVGGAIGPDLTDVAKRLSPEQLLSSLVQPQAEITEGYGLVSFTLDDGSALAGTLIQETPESLTIKDLTGHVQEIDPAKITARTPALSSMPPMDELLTRRELRDLMAYLQTLKRK